MVLNICPTLTCNLELGLTEKFKKWLSKWLQHPAMYFGTLNILLCSDLSHLVRVCCFILSPFIQPPCWVHCIVKISPRPESCSAGAAIMSYQFRLVNSDSKTLRMMTRISLIPRCFVETMMFIITISSIVSNVASNSASNSYKSGM